MNSIPRPPDALLDKLTRENQQWTTADWEKWWCKWWRKRDPSWKNLPVCEKCDCERRNA